MEAVRSSPSVRVVRRPDSIIGGANNRLLGDNAFASEMDGANRPTRLAFTLVVISFYTMVFFI